MNTADLKTPLELEVSDTTPSWSLNMDLIANRKEQKEIAASIMEVWDQCPESGEFTDRQLDTLAHDAYRLAELIQAVNIGVETNDN